MRTWIRITALLTLVSLFGTLAVLGVCFGDNLMLHVSIPNAGTMTLPPSINLNATIGATATTSVQITEIKTNCAWNITVYKESDLESGTKSIPSSQLKISSSAQPSPTEIPTMSEPALIASGAKTGSDGATETIIYHLQLTIDNDAGSYETTHVFTLNTP